MHQHVAKSAKVAHSTFRDFVDFMRERGVIGLAIGVALGAAITKLVAAFVTDLINPIIGMLIGMAGDLTEYTLKIGKAELMWGHFLTTVIDFVVISIVLYIAMRVLKLDQIDKKKT